MGLSLTRTAGQAVLIDGRIRIRVVEIRGGKVRLNIEAPSMEIWREDEPPLFEPTCLTPGGITAKVVDKTNPRPQTGGSTAQRQCP